MMQVPVSEWKRIPQTAKIAGIVLGGAKWNADTSLKALMRLCHYAYFVFGMRLREILRSGKFCRWLSSSGNGIASPLKCCEGIYIMASDDRTGNLTRLTLLASELKFQDKCFLLYDGEGEPIVKRPDNSRIKKHIRRLRAAEASAIAPLAIVVGKSRMPVSSWNDCLLQYAQYVRTSTPFGGEVAHLVPDNAKVLDANSCLGLLNDLIAASKVDPFSVYLEYYALHGAGNCLSGTETESTGGEKKVPAVTKCPATVISDSSPDQKSGLVRVHYRHFNPNVRVW